MANRRNDRDWAPTDPDMTNNLDKTLVDLLQGLQNNGGNRNNRATEHFRQYHPPTFNGRDGPTAVKEWFRSIERIFLMIECDDSQKIACATYQLIEDAGHWWESFTRNQTEDERLAFTWENFKTTVNNKYFPQSYADQKEGEFLHLKQGNMTVTDYEGKFNELSRFAPHLINTDERRSSRFARGLRPQLAGILAAQGNLAYSELVRRDERVEDGLGKSENEPKIVVKEKRKWSEGGDGIDNYKQARLGGSNELTRRNDKPQCQESGKFHSGVCLKGQGKCFRCHLPGHNATNCPRYNQRSGAPRGQGRELSRGNARIYMMTHDNAKGDTKPSIDT